MQRQFSDQYWYEAIEEIRSFSLEQWDDKFAIGRIHLTDFMKNIVMNSNISSLEMIILVIECIKNSRDGQKALFRLWCLDEITTSSPGKFVFIKWLSYAINRIEERVERVEDEGIIGTEKLLVEMKIVANIMELICSFSVIKKNKQLDVLKNKFGVDWFFIVQQVSSTHHFFIAIVLCTYFYLTYDFIRVQTSDFAEKYQLRLMESCLKAQKHLMVFTSVRKKVNDQYCPIFALSNECLRLIVGYAGEKQYRFVACTSYRFHQVCLETFGGKALTSIKNSLVSVSCAELYLDSVEYVPSSWVKEFILLKWAVDNRRTPF